jgi:two-component system OmpR family sensor kinase
LARPQTDQGESPYVVVQVADATAEHDLADFLRKQVRVKNDFIAGVSHELRTPLTAVVGFAEELRRTDVGLPVDAYEMIEIVASQSTVLSHIVEDLLVAAQAEIGELSVERRTVDIRSLVDRIVRSSRHLASETDSSVSATCAEIRAVGDAIRIEQVVRNLVTNAILHGGPSIEVRSFNEGAVVVIEVEDDGEGVPEGAEEEIFTAYRSIGKDTGLPPSIGLGLSVSNTLANMMDGTLAYHRDRDATVFRLTLPAAL